MSNEPAPPSPPECLSDRGSAFWRVMSAEIEFDPKESALLLEACRTLDRIDALENVIATEGVTSSGSTGQPVVHPAVAELRQQQSGFARLMAAVRLPEDEAAADRFRHLRAKAGASARWERPLRAVGRG